MTAVALALRWAETLGVELTPNGKNLDLAGLSRVPKEVRPQFVELVKSVKVELLDYLTGSEGLPEGPHLAVLDYHPSMGRLTFDRPQTVNVAKCPARFPDDVYTDLLEVWAYGLRA